MLVVVLIFLICTLTAQAATQEPEIPDLMTTDVLGYTCVLDEDLDAAFMNAGKGGTVPQTCISEPPVKDCASLTPLLGHEATADQCAVHAYRFLTWLDPDKSTGWGWGCGDCKVYPAPPPAVPLPASALMLMLAIGLLVPLHMVRSKA